MNNTTSSSSVSGKSSQTGSRYDQTLVDQRPTYDKHVFSRKGKVWRPTLKRKNPKWI